MQTVRGLYNIPTYGKRCEILYKGQACNQFMEHTHLVHLTIFHEALSLLNLKYLILQNFRLMIRWNSYKKHGQKC